MDKLSSIKKRVDESRLEYAHYTLARYINDAVENASEFCLWLSVLVNVELSQGNVCLDISSIAQKATDLGWTECPAADELLKAIQSSPVVGADEQVKPLMLENNRLYLNRYYHNEKNIADRLLTMSRINGTAVKLTQLDAVFSPATAIDYQRLAAIISCRHQLSIISGGPGTGKTWTVTKILALLIQQQGEQKLNIKLAAPTGKAAARLSESIHQSMGQMQLADTLSSQIPVEAVTLHRLLGIHRYTHRPRYDHNHVLSCDVLVLDEASMIDQQMMAAICKALPLDSKLILLGDKDQLSSVEAGSVFADLCGGLQQTEFNKHQQQLIRQQLNYELPLHQSDYVLADHVVVLQKSHRFDQFSGIGLLAKSINQGDSHACLQQLKNMDLLSTVSWQNPDEKQLQARLVQQAKKTYLPMMQADSIQQAFALFHDFQILSAVWSGNTGVDQINRQIEDHLKSQMGLQNETEFYRGKPLMMTSNMYQFDIYNGDIGIIWPDQQGQLKVYFEISNAQYRCLSLSQCPDHKTAYAMTVHKSQGSEYKHILLILPYTDTAVCSRELFYTGITRAAETVEIWASESIIKSTINKKTLRASGLPERLTTIA